VKDWAAKATDKLDTAKAKNANIDDAKAKGEEIAWKDAACWFAT